MNGSNSKYRSILIPKIKKLTKKEEGQIIKNQITPWLTGFAAGKLKVKKFDKTLIKCSGILFSGSIRSLFWNNYIEPFLEDVTDRLIKKIAEECLANNLEIKTELHELSKNLQGMYKNVYEAMSRTDQKLRGNGFPNSVPKRDITNEIANMDTYLQQQITMEIAKYNERKKLDNLKQKYSVKNLWSITLWSTVIGAIISAVITLIPWQQLFETLQSFFTF